MESLCTQLLLIITVMFSPSLAVGLSFGKNTLMTAYAAFQRPGSVMEAFCTAPDGFNSSVLYFTLGSMDREFSAAETPQYVSVIDHVTVKFTWQFAKSIIDDSVNIYCRVRGEVDQAVSWMERNLPYSWLEKRLYTIFINNGPSLTKQPLSCTINVKWVSSAGGQATVTCNLTRSNHTEKFTSVRYSVFELNGTSVDSNETLLWSMTDSDPKNGAPSRVTFSFTRDSSAITAINDILFKVVLFESFSGSTVTAFQTLHVLDALILPANTLEWVPFSNGTGFAVSLHNGLMRKQCKQQRRYMAAINVTTAGDDEQFMLTSHYSNVTLLCNPCSGTGDCAVGIAGLTPSQIYSVTLQQLMFDIVPVPQNAMSPPGVLLQQQPISSFRVITDEHVPLTGPEIYQFYQVLDCDTSMELCGSCSQTAAAASSCQVVRIFWKSMTRWQANGQLRFYQVLVSREPGAGTETLNFTADVRTAEVLRYNNQELHIAVAGGTGKGLPAQANWSTCIIPREESGRTVLLGAMVSRESAATRPCNVSWFLRHSLISETPTATLLYCSSKADRCLDYSFVTMRPWLTDNANWQPLQRFVWSSSQIDDASHHMCRDGTLAVAVAYSQEEQSPPTTSMNRLLEVNCRFSRQNDARPAPPKITLTYSDYRSVCVKWLPFSRSCGAAQGLPVSLNISLWSSDRSRLLEQQHMEGDATSHCFTENVAEAETYYASLVWTIDVGLPVPQYVSSDEVRLRTPGLTIAAKSGVIFGGVVSGVLMVIGLIGCVRKARVYRNTWRGNLTIPKIRVAAANNCQDTSLLDSVSFLHQTISPSKNNQKSSSPRFTQTPMDMQANRLRKWSSKDSAFASQDGSMPTTCNERLAYGDARLLTDCQHQQDSDCSADVAGQVYTTVAGLTHADFIASPPREFLCSQAANGIQNCRPLMGEDDSTVAYLPNEASLLTTALTTGHQRCGSIGSGSQPQLLGDCTSPRMLVDTCNLSEAGRATSCGEEIRSFHSFRDKISDVLPNTAALSPTSSNGHHSHGTRDPDATGIAFLRTPIYGHKSWWSSDITVGADDSSSGAYAAEATSSSTPSDYIRATDEESHPTVPAAGFRCSACLDDMVPRTSDYISISDALKQADL